MNVNLLASTTADHEQLGRYRLVAQLGQGGMGTIHLGVTSGLGEFRKLLVVKELQRDLAQNDRFVDMFMAEAKLAARLNHPNIVQTIEAGEEAGRYFLSMEFLEGQPLTALLKRATIEPVVSLGLRIQILCEVLAGLQYAHELCDFDGTPYQIVHRDVTPHNVFVTYHGQVKLVDFGIAKAVDVESLTTAGVFKGKFSYAAPEQVRGEIVDHRSDLFSVGVMLWEAIAMKRFAAGAPTRSMVDKRLEGSEPRIAEVVPTVEPLLAEICDRAIHVDPNQRYQSAEAFRAELQRFLLISGESPSITLGDLMQAKFAAEKAAMQRLIDAQVKRDDRSQSNVRLTSSPLPLAAPERFREEPTLVGDLSRHIERSRVDNPIGGIDPLPAEWSGSLRGRSRVRWIVATVGLLVGASLWLHFDGERPHEVRPAAPLPAAPDPVATQLAPPSLPAEPAPAPAAAAPAPAPAPEPTPSPEPAVLERVKSSARESVARPERPRHDDALALSPAAPPAPAAPPSPEAKPRPSPPQPEAAAAHVGRPPEVGQDLRLLPRPAQRPLDLEDPFR